MSISLKISYFCRIISNIEIHLYSPNLGILILILQLNLNIMNFDLKDRLFLVTGSSSGFGKAIATLLAKEGAHVIINARGEGKLVDLKNAYPESIEIVQGDITTDAVISKVLNTIGERWLDGAVINAGGPPAMPFAQTVLQDWDNAYESILRWKVKITKELLPKLEAQFYGRLVFIESASVKQPVENLILSTSLRLAVVGFVKSLSQEIASKGITANVLAPGYHATPAMERLFEARSVLLGVSPQEARKEFESETNTGKLGDPMDFATLACWLLSPQSRFITGQTISVDGGLIKSTMG
jgi:3-oxoacyl-[acyl-carrier protein] reductase